jgi:signal transduction histidine kinase
MSIKLKMIIWFSVIILLVGILGAYAVNEQLDTAKVLAIKDAEHVAASIAASIVQEPTNATHPALFRDHNALEDYIEKLHLVDKRDLEVIGLNRKIIADAIVADIGEVYHYDGNNEVGKTIADAQSRTFNEVSKDHPYGIKQIVVPLKTEKNKIIGALLLDYTPIYDEMVGFVRKVIWQMVFASLICLFLSLGFGLFFARSISNPINKLKEAAMEIMQGNLAANADIDSKDEIGDLARAFNQMTRDIAESNQKLQIEITERKRAEAKLRDLTQRILALQEKERRQLSWELQEDLAQNITTLKMEFRTFAPKLPADDEKLRQDYLRALEKIDGIVENLRHRAKDLSPQMLADLGLNTGLKMLCESYQLECLCDMDDLTQSFTEDDQVNIYRIFQEALNNVRLHAQASQVTLSAKKTDNRVDFLIEDNGRGFDVGEMENVEAGRKGIGLLAMSERVRALGGTFKIESQIGVVTRIFFSIPKTGE